MKKGNLTPALVRGLYLLVIATLLALNTFASTPPPPARAVISLSTTTQLRRGSTTINLNVVPLVHIHDVQGTTHISSYNGQQIALTPAIVTAIKPPSASSNGFWMEEPQSTWDNSDNTSEGIFVFTSSSVPTVLVGDMVNVSGPVSEYRPGGSGSTNLTITEINAPTSIQVISHNNPLPPAVIIGSGGRLPPSTVIEDDATGDVETSGIFDPANDGIDFWESLEGMLVQVNNAVAVGPTKTVSSGSKEIPVVADDATSAMRTSSGGIVVRSIPDFNPERLILSNAVATLPKVNVGDHFASAVVGVVDYSFGNFKLQATSSLAALSGGLQPGSVTPAGTAQLAIATLNVNNLSPNDPQSKFDALASQIVNNLQSPDIIAVEEVEDNNGVTDDGTVAADLTWGALINAIATAGGPTYSCRQIDPINDAEGGVTGGNIRVGFLFRTDRGLSFIDRPGGDSTTATMVVNDASGVHLSYSPGRIDPLNTAWSTPEGTRRSLAGEFMFNGHHLFAIGNHFKSKGGTPGDQPLYGHYQPPVLTTEDQRKRQAQLVHDFVNTILGYDANADVVVLGDLNDFQFSPPLTILKGTILTDLTDLIDTLPENERYTYDYDGNSEALDHILVSNHLLSFPHTNQVVHVNAEFAVQASDHDPQVLQLTLKANTTTTVTSSPNPSVFGQSVTFTATVTSTVGTPTGVVSFTIDGATVTGTLDANGVAAYVTNTLGVGDYPVTATYGGDANDNGSTSPAYTHTVNKANTTTALMLPLVMKNARR